jgi:hypothetical protein
MVQGTGDAHYDALLDRHVLNRVDRVPPAHFRAATHVLPRQAEQRHDAWSPQLNTLMLSPVTPRAERRRV